MPNFYNYTQDGLVYSFDDVFVPADAFREGNLWTWGSNAWAQLGDSTFITRSTPVTTFLGGTNWKSIASGGYHAVALKTDGTLWAWGQNVNGQLGINVSGPTSVKCTPVTTFLGGSDWKSIAAGGFHTVALKTDGTLWTWGTNLDGQLGDNTTVFRSTPVTTFLGGTNWKSIACGNKFTVAIKTDGTLWTWGDNGFGSLGINDIGAGTNRSTPVTTFLGGTNWKSISGGAFYTGALKTDGTLWTWGQNSSAQLGVNDTTHRNTPVTTFLGGTNWKSISSGYFYTVALTFTDPIFPT